MNADFIHSHLAIFSQWIQLHSPIPQAQDSELRHVGDLAAGATSEEDARVGACQELPRCAGMIFKAGSFKRKLRGKMSEMSELSN